MKTIFRLIAVAFLSCFLLACQQDAAKNYIKEPKMKANQAKFKTEAVQKKQNDQINKAFDDM
ncbi:hypothetical protein JNK13_11090 [bacterium]|nr:hypothetical protein [bacterium]